MLRKILIPDDGGKVAVECQSGMAALHYNVDEHGEPDRHSMHQGMPVESGEKWLLGTTLRENSPYPAAESAGDA